MRAAPSFLNTNSSRLNISLARHAALAAGAAQAAREAGLTLVATFAGFPTSGQVDALAHAAASTAFTAGISSSRKFASSTNSCHFTSPQVDALAAAAAITAIGAGIASSQVCQFASRNFQVATSVFCFGTSSSHFLLPWLHVRLSSTAAASSNNISSRGSSSRSNSKSSSTYSRSNSSSKRSSRSYNTRSSSNTYSGWWWQGH